MEQPLANPPEVFNIEDLEQARDWIVDFSEWASRIPDLIPRINIYTTTIDPAPVGANTTNEQSFALVGLQGSDVVVAAQKPSHSTGLAVVGARVPGADTIAITFLNATGATINAPAETYTIITIRN